MQSERNRLKNTVYKVVRYEIQRPANFIKERLIQRRIEYDAKYKKSGKGDNVLELREEARPRALSQGAGGLDHEDTLADVDSQH